MAGYRFGDCQLDTDARQLFRDGKAQRLSPKAFQLLQILVEAAPRALAKSTLQDQVWPDTFVVEANLQHLVTEIRSALADNPRRPRFVRTVHGYGYAFQEPVVPIGRTVSTDAAVVCLLRWDGGRVRLTGGEHVVGRDPAADVLLDASSVSRRHARIRVGPADVTLEDTGSKNGSFVGGRRITEPVTLTDGDEIRIGMVPLTVRILTEAGLTETAILDAEQSA